MDHNNPLTPVEENLSAIQDGELSGEELLASIDALVESDELRGFWRQSRQMQLALSAPAAVPAETPPGHLWDSIQARGLSRKRAKVFRLDGFKPQVWAAAASIVLIFSLTLAGLFRGAIPGEANARVIELGSAEGRMSEERFLEITTELLQADSRYHRKMYEVMATVNREAYGLSGDVRSDESGERTENRFRDTGDSGDTPANAAGNRDPGTARNPEDQVQPRSNREDDRPPVRLNLW